MRRPGIATLARWRRDERLLAARMAEARTDCLRRLSEARRRFQRGDFYGHWAREKAIELYLERRLYWTEVRDRIRTGVALRRVGGG